MEGGRKPVILAVDDMLHELKACELLLGDHFTVLTASSAENMFCVLRSCAPDLILLDVMMPVVDGYKAALALKGDKRYRDIPIIFVTGATDEASESVGFAVGAVDYAHKPFSKAQLIKRIEAQLRIVSHQREINELRTLLNTIGEKVRESGL